MKDGFVKVAAASPRTRVADVRFNRSEIISLMEEAARGGAKLVVFPELCVTGCTCGDLFANDALLAAAASAVDAAARRSADLDMTAVIGAPVRAGCEVYDCAVVINRGRVLAAVPRAFDTGISRALSACAGGGTIEINGERVPFGNDIVFRCGEMPAFAFGVSVGEDIWSPLGPAACQAAAGAAIIVHLGGGSETVCGERMRARFAEDLSRRLHCAFVSAEPSGGESTTDEAFSGGRIIAEDGAILNSSPLFSEGLIFSEADVSSLSHERGLKWPKGTSVGTFREVGFRAEMCRTELTRKIAKNPFLPDDEGELAERCDRALEIQAAGLKKRIEHSGARSAVIGISGGLDSCLALLVSVRATELLGRPRTDVIAVTMPCFGTTQRTRSNAEIICERLGVQFRCVDITKTVLSHFEDIGHPKDSYNVTFENAQARERTQVIMDIANETGGLVVGTGDLSELALGWATFNGDHMSMYGVNAGVSKTFIREMTARIADTCGDETLAKTLRDVLATPVSPELLPADSGEIAQRTENIVGPYELHDFFLYYMVRKGFSPAKIFRLAKHVLGDSYDDATIKLWLRTFLRRFFTAQFKRSCLADGPRVGSLSLSPRGGLCMPSDACFNLWLDEAERL